MALIEQRSRFYEEQKETPHSIERLTIDFVISQLNAALIWLDECDQKLNFARLAPSSKEWEGN
jgi:hypothetical protein